MARRIFWKIFGTFLLGIVILTSLILFFSYRTIRENYIETHRETLTSLNKNILLEVGRLVTSEDIGKLQEYVGGAGKNMDVRITIVAVDGTVLADSHKDPKLMDNHSRRPEIKASMKGGRGSIIRYSYTVKAEMLYVALPIKNDGKIIGVSRVSYYLSHINALVDSLIIRIIAISIFVSIAFLIAAFIFSRKLSNPISSLVAVSKRVALGDFNIQVNLKNRDELGELGNSFNYMINQIKQLFDEIRLQKEELSSLFSSLQEGFVVLNSEGNILLFNDGFKKIAKKKVEIGKDFTKVVQDKELIKLFNKISKRKGSVVKEIDLPDKSILCSVTYIQAKNEIIFLFSDITEIKNLERIKRDIVANVSHELRTPLTAIKGYIETLDEEIETEGKYYLDVIKRHTDRLINIVNDLLVLSELERTSTKLELSEVNLSEVCSTVLKLFEQRVKEKNIKVECNIEADLPVVQLDLFKIEQALINLIDNSIKYTNEGEIKIEIKREEDNILIVVKDTGIGIPPEHQERIFERFYTVDKSRSRKPGGTGLGLSIVKHIVKLHNGEIFLKSTPNKGTRFTIQLPIKSQVEIDEGV